MANKPTPGQPAQPQMSPQDQQQLRQLGLDPQNLDLGGILGKVRLLLDLIERLTGGGFFGQQPQGQPQQTP